MTESRVFLEALCSGKPDDLYVLLWTLPEKQSQWLLVVEDAVAHAEAMAGHDLYIGVGLARQDYGPKQRCKSEDIAGIAGLWADIDLRSDAHPKATLPGSVEEALSILPSEFPPSMVILTGNGAHVWWLFREPWIFESEEEHHTAAALVSRWHTLLRDNASQRGWTYERLADLARVLRVPGTTNFKDPANPKSVTLHSHTDSRFNPSEFAEYLEEMGVSDGETEASSAREWAERFKDKPINIDLSARIPESKLNEWLESDMKFKNTWFRQRHDLRDQSQSGYDLALACFGFRAGLEEQRIVDLLVHHRAVHKQKHRTRIDYFQRTLAKAALRVSDDVSPAKQDFDNPPKGGDASEPDNACSENPGAQGASQSKALICRRLSQAFGIEILRIVKISGKDPLYRIETAMGSMHFDNVGKLISQSAVRTAIAATIGKLINRFKPSVWEALAQALLDACIVEEGSEELHEDTAARMHIGHYLAETAFIPSIEGQTSQEIRRPMVRDGRLTVCASDLQMYINKTTQQNLSVRAVAAMLSAIGATTVRVRGKKIKDQSRWELPLREFDPGDYTVLESEDTVRRHG